jgi:hypothetical protein
LYNIIKKYFDINVIVIRLTCAAEIATQRISARKSGFHVFDPNLYYEYEERYEPIETDIELKIKGFTFIKYDTGTHILTPIILNHNLKTLKHIEEYLHVT